MGSLIRYASPPRIKQTSHLQRNRRKFLPLLARRRTEREALRAGERGGQRQSRVHVLDLHRAVEESVDSLVVHAEGRVANPGCLGTPVRLIDC